ncbi:MAG: alanine racemase [Anaerococcus vaginalis]|nr:alanine racemase [Anaerococcus vaginalis]
MEENYLLVDLDKILNNINLIKEKAQKSKFCAVLKADAYGLGALEVAKHIKNNIDYIAVAQFKEAKYLRENGIDTPILILGYLPLDKYKECSKLKVDVVIYDLSYAKEINSSLNTKINCHIALDTGHTRIGFRDFEIDKIRELKNLKNLNFIGAFSHFATADEKDLTYTKIQYEKFTYITNQIKDDFDLKLIHIANSAASMEYDFKSDLLRVGISLYGIYPSDYLKEVSKINLEQAFEFKAQISFVKKVKKGTSISYGRTFFAENDMKVATVAIGYADGFKRSFSNLGEVLVNGKLAKIVGRVCMDQMMIDVSNIECEIGDYVTLYPDIYKEAKKINTIPYELMTSISKRVPRIYKYNSKIVGECNEG